MRLIDADAIKYDFSIKTYADNGVIVTSLLADKDTIDAMPTVEPEPCEDVVSRNAIVQKLNKMDRYVSEELRLCDTDKKFPKNEVFIVDDVYEEIVEKLPSTQPEIIRCKDCKHLQKWRSEESAKKFGQIYECGRNVLNHPKPEDFCSHAERRTDE